MAPLELPSKETRTTGALSQINLTPLIDVALTLLIIFMITAPFMYRGIDVNVPQTKSGKPTNEQRVMITITKEGRVFVNDQPVLISILPQRLKELAVVTENRPVFLRADKEVPYGKVMEVMDLLKEAGIEKVGLITTPPSKLLNKKKR
ncbi:MAG: biopolymer transporter ExbD [Acidobacteria bacterium]|nr:biopolymer transporter ExbD [Acidobacteriota bacterium]